MKHRLHLMGLSIMILCLLVPVYPVLADGGNTEEEPGSEQLWRDLNRTSDTILQYIKEGRYDEAKQLLDQFSGEFLSIRSSDSGLSMNDLRVIVSSYEQAEQAAVSMNMPHEERVRAASSFRLLVDVYERSHRPLWKNTKDTLTVPLTGMAEAYEASDWTTYQQHLNRFLSSYERVRPAWQVSLEPHIYQRFHSQVVYVERNRQEPASVSNMVNTLAVMLSDLDDIYADAEKESSDPSVIWVMLSIGGIILAALSYTGWKKYKAHRLGQIQRQRYRE
ncbi:sporulation protein YpjB [Alteribacter natronophilus]|uniref:sporulation protein YpjB n=1 Tax=Alteribacter natronophilus TaxID=2583810 RepID=UPI00110E2F07|nr:sporulation protein YpjB [Alteribacter natronophilus]TMW73578.1 hypothetical protein FGB90_04575 [Alteribacter natronophilus]